MTLPWMLAPAPGREARTRRICANCAHFDAGAKRIEAQFAGFASLASGYASVRGDDGFCDRHERLLGASGRCAEFALRAQRTAA
ncbi:MAG: hypothetical protein QM741_03060 [Rudaea sp.]|uniref:hypothetical protein n=1 Tax=Rudaea sp. TaxID=2136325 RepID=UPI0039E61091